MGPSWQGAEWAVSGGHNAARRLTNSCSIASVAPNPRFGPLRFKRPASHVRSRVGGGAGVSAGASTQSGHRCGHPP